MEGALGVQPSCFEWSATLTEAERCKSPPPESNRKPLHYKLTNCRAFGVYEGHFSPLSLLRSPQNCALRDKSRDTESRRSAGQRPAAWTHQSQPSVVDHGVHRPQPVHLGSDVTW